MKEGDKVRVIKEVGAIMTIPAIPIDTVGEILSMNKNEDGTVLYRVRFKAATRWILKEEIVPLFSGLDVLFEVMERNRR